MLKMDVINLPGEYHDEILQMGDAARQAVFSPRKRLHHDFGKRPCGEGRDGEKESHSSGDGAWIMRKCAKTLGGDCDIRFEVNRTIFSLRCPATPFDVALKRSTHVDPDNFKLPDNIWGIAIDDSKIQRRLLERLFVMAGIKLDRCMVLGKDADEIRGFDNLVVQHIGVHPNDYFFLIADENLDIVEDATRHVTLSGSLFIESIRCQLLPDQEHRVLALIRSANDSSQDVAIYKSRAHGFLPKEPIKREGVMEMLAPIWERRYPSSTAVPNDAFRNKRSCNRSPSLVIGDSSNDLVFLKDLMVEVEELDRLCAGDLKELSGQWPLISKRLHLLKGDLKSMPSNGRASAAVEMISSMQGSLLPPNFRGKWLTIRGLVVCIH